MNKKHHTFSFGSKASVLMRAAVTTQINAVNDWLPTGLNRVIIEDNP